MLCKALGTRVIFQHLSQINICSQLTPDFKKTSLGLSLLHKMLNLLSASPTKWPNTLKQFVGELFECVWPFCEIGT